MSETERLPNTINLAFVEGLYLDYLEDPSSVPTAWRAYFEKLSNSDRDGTKARPSPTFRPPGIFNCSVTGSDGPGAREGAIAALQNRVDQLIRNYRVRGHMIAAIDPLAMPRPRIPELDPEYYAFAEADMDRIFSCDTLCDSSLTATHIAACSSCVRCPIAMRKTLVRHTEHVDLSPLAATRTCSTFTTGC
jgi:2-oxoglutarate dehydrogenase E1 component